MQTLKTWGAKGRENLGHLADQGKQRSGQVKNWALVGGSAAIGGGAMTVLAKGGAISALVNGGAVAATATGSALTFVTQGALSVLGALTAPPVALTAGVIGGGLAGWNYLQRRAQQNAAEPNESVPADLAEPATVGG